MGYTYSKNKEEKFALGAEIALCLQNTVKRFLNQPYYRERKSARTMIKLAIKDLEKNVELDRKTMRDLCGGINVNDIIYRVLRESIIEQNKDKKYWKKRLGQLGF